jgi:hypothetical protein
MRASWRRLSHAIRVGTRSSLRRTTWATFNSPRDFGPRWNRQTVLVLSLSLTAAIDFLLLILMIQISNGGTMTSGGLTGSQRQPMYCLRSSSIREVNPTTSVLLLFTQDESRPIFRDLSLSQSYKHLDTLTRRVRYRFPPRALQDGRARCGNYSLERYKPGLNNMGGLYCENVDIAEAVPAVHKEPYGVVPWAFDSEAAAGPSGLYAFMHDSELCPGGVPDLLCRWMS